MDDLNLRAVSHTLQEIGVRHFLAHGTLLGLIREGDFIPWDKDIDFALFDPKSSDILALQASLIGRGFDVVAHRPTRNMKLVRPGGMKVDLNFYFPVRLRDRNTGQLSIWRRTFLIPDAPKEFFLLRKMSRKALRKIKKAHARGLRRQKSMLLTERQAGRIKAVIQGPIILLLLLLAVLLEKFERFMFAAISKKKKEAWYELPDSLVDFQRYEFEDYDIMIPKEPELVLEATYGVDWRKPKRSTFWWEFKKSSE